MNAVGYLRVSTLEQTEKFGLPSQRRDIDALAAAHGLDIVEMFEDALTGDMLSRPGFDAMLARLDAGGIEAVVVSRIDRLGRGATEADDIAYDALRQIFQRGVPVVSQEGEDPFVQKLMAIMAGHLKRSDLRRRTEGKLTAVRAGGAYIGARPPYGYNVEMQNGLPKLVINPATVEHVRRIYRDYAAGMPLRQLAKALTAEHVPTNLVRLGLRKAGVWEVSTVRRLIASETYAGRFFYRKKQWVSSSSGKKKVKSVVRPRSEWIQVDVPRIVTDSLWKKANQRLRDNTELRGRVPSSGAYILKGRVRCGHCQRLMHVRKRGKWHQYRCKSKSDTYADRKCAVSDIHGGQLEQAVIAWLLTVLRQPEQLEAWLDQQVADAGRAGAEMKQRLTGIESQLADLEKRRGRLLDALEAGKVAGAEFDKRAARIDREREPLDAAHADLLDQIQRSRVWMHNPERERREWSEIFSRAAGYLADIEHWADSVDIVGEELSEGENEYLRGELVSETRAHAADLVREALLRLDVMVVVRGQGKRRKVTVSCHLDPEGKVIGADQTWFVGNPNPPTYK